MKKIVAAFDGLKFSNSTNEYALWLATKTNTHLVGVFMDDATHTSYNAYKLLVEDKVPVEELKNYEERDRLLRRASADIFKKACEKQKLEFSIHHNKEIAIQGLKHESIYADLIIIDTSETHTHFTETLPTRFIRDLLTDIQCPVILVPKKYEQLTKLVLLYDGEPSSVYAIKMFSYLLPELKYLETEVVTVNEFAYNFHLPENKLMKEFMKRHFPDATYTVLTGSPEEEILKHLKKVNEDTLIVLGAYRRGAISRWFRESMADVLQAELRAPLFIAHR